MPKAKPTVFEQLRSADANAAQDRRWHALSRAGIIVACVALLAVLFPGGLNESGQVTYDDALLGTIWTDESIVAELTFPVARPRDDVERDRDSARRAAPYVFRFDSTARTRATMALRRIASAMNDDQFASANLPRHIVDAISALDGSTRSTVVEGLRRYGIDMISAAYRHGVADASVAQRTAEAHIVAFEDGQETLIATAALADTTRLYRYLVDRDPRLNAVVAALIVDIVDHVLLPDLRIDEKLSKQTQQRAEASVARTQGIVQRGDVILKKGAFIGKADLAVLSAYRLTQNLRGETGTGLLIVLGSILHASVIVSILFLYIFTLRRTSWESLGQCAGLATVVVISAAFAWLSVAYSTNIPLQFLIVVPAFSMLISVLFDVRVALTTTLVMALTVAGVRSNDYGIALIMFVGGSLGAYSTNNLQNRTQMFTSMLAIGAGLVVSVIAVDIERSVPLSLIWPKLAFSVANAVVSPLIAFAVIIVLEKVFNVATDLRLEEFDNLSHPLLQQLAERAPGTYQHTLAVARLAETAAASIGANVVLAKVGALFHDIGKLEKAEYFVENQIDIDNKHDRLTPKRSAAIIRQHVQDGIDLARRSGLPDRIIQFIPMHHGTILIKHFYAKALDETLLKESIVDEQDYRYPGPKPTSREAAIVMLADAVEALSRLVDTSSRDEVDAAVQQIITDRLNDGQLSLAPLTTADIERIRESFVKNLIGSTHQRVRYMQIPPDTEVRSEVKE